MAKSVDFAVRDIAGGVSRGTVAGDGAGDFIQVGDGDAISLNLRKTNILKYERAGSDLHVVLTDGRVVELTGYFDVPSNKLYISADGEITQVNLEDSGEGVLFANYSEPEIIGKWSPNDELAFLDGDDILAPVEEDTAGMAGFAPLMGVGPLLAGGAALAGAAALGGGSGDDDDTTDEDDDGTTDDGNEEPDDEDTTDEDDDDTTDDGNEEPDDEDTTDEDDDGTTDDGDDEPDDEDTTDEDDDDTTDDGDDEPDDEDTTDEDDDDTTDDGDDEPDDEDTTDDGDDEPDDEDTTDEDDEDPDDEDPDDDTDLGADPVITPTVNDPDADYTLTTNTEDPKAEVSGTGETGSTVEVILGDQIIETTVDENGDWSVVFEDETFPSDGDLTSTVVVTAPGGTEYTLDGPDFLIDMTPPEVTITYGAESTSDVENLAEYADGISVGGTGEIGASITVTINGEEQSTAVDPDGNWSVTFTQDQLAGGEYSVEMVVTATDVNGNVTVLNDVLVVDTELNVTFDADAVTSDNIVNEAEVSSGFTLSGTTDTDATSVSVTLNGASYEAVIAEDGSWSAVIDDASLVTGDYTVSITATDAAGNVSTITDTVSVDTDMDVAFSSASVTSDNIVNAAEASAGFTLSGTTDTDAASVTVTLNGKSYDAVVAEDGSWTATVTDSALADGTYTATVTATDFAGNVATDTKAVTVDSSISVGINSTQMADNVISGSETTGVILTGTAEALSTVTISFGSGTRTVVAGEDGTWSANFAASEVPADSDMAEISATATDSYGNTATTNQTIKVDTVLDTLTVATGTPDSVLADGVVNASEASGGLLLTGTVEVGAQSVTVALADGTTVIATVDAEAGTWTATIDAADLPDSGDATETLTVTAVDAYGNSGSTTLDVVFDTVVENFSVASVTADNTVNGAEATEGFAISGTVEAGSTITVTIDQTGATQTIVVGEDGTWSAAFDVDDLPEGTGTATYSISATDVHGNVLDGTNASAANGSFIYDLEAPDSPDVTWATIQSGKVRAIYTDSDGEADSYTVSGINSDGTVTELDNSATATDDGSGEDIYSFDSQAMSTYFAVTDVDAAGNESSTLTVTSESEITLNLDRDGLDQFDFSKIDLDLADVNLTISADQIMAMTGHENTLVIEGDSDDSVNVSGMTVATDDAQDMDGYTLYTLDDGDAKLYVDNSISTTVI
ncbi:Ig-like domain-containing protein [Thioclava sp. GXIMD2076]|uniref:Ig-like domain-containing protein n=1 Tax=Thioclava sp. GXIMD2076 TaxID=3131931 RepID=UPI0030CD33DB